MNSIGMGGSASREAMLEAELDAEVEGAELIGSDTESGESLHPTSENRATGRRSLLN